MPTRTMLFIRTLLRHWHRCWTLNPKLRWPTAIGCGQLFQMQNFRGTLPFGDAFILTGSGTVEEFAELAGALTASIAQVAP